MNRIVVTGATGCGKTTVAAHIAKTLGIGTLDLDAVYQLDDWRHLPEEAGRERIRYFIKKHPQWVISSGGKNNKDISWSNADVLIWLDYPFRVIFWRLFKRTLKRIVSQEELWGTNNRESWRHLRIRLLWLIKRYQPLKREFSEALAEPRHQHLTVLRHQNPRDTEQFLKELAKGTELKLPLQA